MSALATQTVVQPANSVTSAPRLDSPLHSFGLEAGLQRARRCLLALQNRDGHWRGELQGDTILESEYILLMAFLGRANEEKVRKAANYLLTQERADGGGWSNHPDGPVDLNVSVKAYFALKIVGHAPDEPVMQRARAAILKLGGAVNANSYTKFYLACLGQFPYENCAAVPPEMIFLPKWCYFNLYAMSAWTRTIIVPLSLFYAHKPRRQLPAERGMAELFVADPHKKLWPHPPTKRLFTWTNFFLAGDQVIKWFENWGPATVRQRAIAKAEQWMLEHFTDSDGVGAIFPPIIYTIISLTCLGYTEDSPQMQYALRQLDDLMIEEDDTLRVQPCFSPVWDTALSLNALALAGNLTSQERKRQEVGDAIAKATHWLLEREVQRPGDWSLLNPGLEPGGWYFEYRNGFYPDIDDTAMVLMGLARSGQAWDRSPHAPREGNHHAERDAYGDRSPHAPHEGNHHAERDAYGDRSPHAPHEGNHHAERDGHNKYPLIPAVQRGLTWLMHMQNQDGGWAAFDRDINHEILTKVPFADHNAMLDPSCPDITARVLEALGQFGIRVGHPQVERGVAFIAQTQDPRGCWIGRWGVNYLYGTWQVLQGLEAAGFGMKHPMVQHAVAWLKKVQQENGGWGETCRSYDDPALAGQGTVTASQTAWALLGLIAAGEAQADAVQRGIRYLTETQDTDGNWREDQFTGTGFPKVFYLKYHMYRLYFPLMALARYKRALVGTAPATINYPWPAANTI